MLERFKDFCIKDDGVTAIEYALIASLIALVIIGSVTILGQKVQNKYQDVSTAIP